MAMKLVSGVFLSLGLLLSLSACGSEELSPPTIIAPNSPPQNDPPAAPPARIRSDFDKDGNPDLVTTFQSYISIWLMKPNANAPNALSRVSERFIAPMPAGFSIVASADFDGDANFDLVIMNGSTRKLSIMKLAGADGMVFTDTLPLKQTDGTTDFVVPTGLSVEGSIDYDFDQKPDLLLWNPTVGNDVRVYKFDGIRNISNTPIINQDAVTPQPGPNFSIVGLYEFQDQNKWSIFWQAKSTANVPGEIYRWTMTGTTRLIPESDVMKNYTASAPPSQNLIAASPWLVVGVRKFSTDSSISMILQDTRTAATNEWKYVRWRFQPNFDYAGLEFISSTPTRDITQMPPAIQQD